jgi:hypothetical protein
VSFEALLEEFDTLQKSLAAQAQESDKDDEEIQAAADEGSGNGGVEGGGEGRTDGDNDEDDEEDDEDEDEDGQSVLGKSFAFTLDNGEVVEAVDGTELVKSLMGRIDNNESQVTAALAGALGLIKQQGDMIKSLTDKVSALGAEGRGRKAALTVHEKPAAGSGAAQQKDGVPAGEFMHKCLQAQAAGRITGQDVSRAQIALNSGVAVPADIVSRVAG